MITVSADARGWRRVNSRAQFSLPSVIALPGRRANFKRSPQCVRLTSSGKSWKFLNSHPRVFIFFFSPMKYTGRSPFQELSKEVLSSYCCYYEVSVADSLAVQEPSTTEMTRRIMHRNRPILLKVADFWEGFLSKDRYSPQGKNTRLRASRVLMPCPP